MPWKKIKEYLWVVRQTQPSDDYEQRTIAIYENREDAENIARKLNEVLGRHVLQAVVFEPYSDITVCVIITSKKEVYNG